jgi:hypothetical protein
MAKQVKAGRDFNAGIRWGAGGEIEQIGLLSLPEKMPEVKINVEGYPPLKKKDIARGFSEAFNGYCVALGVGDKPENNITTDRAAFIRQLDIEAIDGSSAQTLEERTSKLIVKSDLISEDVALCAGIVAGFRLIESASYRRRFENPGLLKAVTEKVGLDEDAGQVHDWSQKRWQELDEHVRATVKDKGLLRTYERFTDDLFNNLSNHLRNL